MVADIYLTRTSSPDAIGTGDNYILVNPVSLELIRVITGYLPGIDYSTFAPIAFGALPPDIQPLVLQYCFNPTDLVISKLI